MRIFITGGSGFIGKFVVEQLIRNKHSLLLLLPEKDTDWFRSKYGKATRLVKGDLGNIKEWSSTVKKFKPDAAIHLAWEGIPDFSAGQSIKNLKYSLDLLTFLAEIKCQTVLSPGSCWEYGDVRGKINENHPIFSDQPFMLAKNTIRIFGNIIAQESGQHFIWTRLFYVYGPGQRKFSIIPYLLNCSKKGIDPEIKNLDARHDFIYVEDVARSIAGLIEKKYEAGSSVFNIGSGKLTSLEQILNIIYPNYKKSGFLSKSRSAFYADISKIKKEIKWKPEVGIVEGIHKIKASIIDK